MATNLYETLGVDRNASTEEIRRAYRRRALETHPDRLPQGASAAEKSASEDMFRKVNNAYEVLSDAQKRGTYDHHGVWPPPTTPPQGPFANGPHDPFSDPFFQDPFSRVPFGRPRMDPFGFGGFGPHFGPPRGFTDPFVLFNSMFGDFHRAFESDPFFDDHFGRRGFGSSPFGGGFFSIGFPSMFPTPMDFNGNGMRGISNSRMQTFSSNGSNGRWVSESWNSSTVNGVTHTKRVQRDSEGNEHVTYRLPDGTERYTINGIEQPNSQSQRTLPYVPPTHSETPSTSAPPPYSEAVTHPPRRPRAFRHHGHHHDHHGDSYEPGDRLRHDYRTQDRDIYGTERSRHDDREDGRGKGEPQDNGSSWKFWRS